MTNLIYFFRGLLIVSGAFYILFAFAVALSSMDSHPAPKWAFLISIPGFAVFAVGIVILIIFAGKHAKL